MRLAWATDIHLNFLPRERIVQFGRRLARQAADALVISGDIAEADSFEHCLGVIHEVFRGPIYFVLGNHDYYRGSIEEVRARARALTHQSNRLHWLPASGVVELTPDTALVGHDGWADGRLGNYRTSTVLLNDYLLIRELAGLDSHRRLDRLQHLADESAEWTRTTLFRAFEHYRRVVFVTHVPPFREACQRNSPLSDENWLPHFSNKAMGDTLARVMTDRPDRALTVLCGHTHGASIAKILPNLQVRTGGAEYGRPAVQGLLQVP
jgi:predicted phosphodiesterase